MISCSALLLSRECAWTSGSTSTLRQNSGKLLGVQAIVSGTVESITATESKQTTASSGNGSSSVKRTAKVVVALRMYSTESGEIIFIGKATADTTDGVARQVVVGPNVINCLRRPKDCLQGGGSGQWQSQPISPDAADALVSGVIASAIDSIGKKVAADFEKVLSRAPKVAAPKVQVASNPPQIVGEVEGELVINRGTEAQIVEGDSLQIERKDATIGDGENQIQTTTVIGTFVVTSVGDGWSKGTFRPRKSPRPKLPQKGDMIKMTRK
ncbi:MAG: hypothetical protein IPJ56_01450 [Gemmatimonadetes bacterium]|nr:hypothetical protein [Gemmatimonadota bacterium]